MSRQRLRQQVRLQRADAARDLEISKGGACSCSGAALLISSLALSGGGSASFGAEAQPAAAEGQRLCHRQAVHAASPACPASAVSPGSARPR
jgi:hypothetical protein